jgi:hypothetical protein
VLGGQGEELTHGLGVPQGREQPGHHAPEQLIRLQVHWRLRQPWVAPVQERGAQQAQPADRPGGHPTFGPAGAVFIDGGGPNNPVGVFGNFPVVVLAAQS